MNKYRLTPLRDTKGNRDRIIANTRKKLQDSQNKSRQSWKPVIIGAFALLVAIFLGAPYIQQAFMDKDYTIEKVVIPGTDYDSLIGATYTEIMEKEMARYKELGQQRSWERQYVKYKYLKPLVDSLEEQMNEEK